MRYYLILFVFIFSFSNGIKGQEESERLKIGVVLSGGGAKGISHVGVLKAMEKAGIRPDFIAGTSMGAVIGGLYAVGYSPDTLEKIVREIDWDQVLSNKIPLNYISYEEKFYYDRYLINFPIKNYKITLPNGLIEGQMLSELLSNYTWKAGQYENFDEFPIPFRCIATDVSTGDEYIFKDGPLSLAMRASMAIPTAFTSVENDSTLFVDGGIVNNFPVEVLKEMGADIIIGVNVSSSGFEKAEDINNIPGILMQMSMINSLKKLPEQIEACDIYIEPELTGYSTASFSSYEEILEVGDRAGAKFYPQFVELAKELNLSDSTYIGLSLGSEAITISEIELNGNDLTPDYVVSGKLGIKAGDIVTLKHVELGVRSIYGLNNFSKVVYHIDKIKGEDEHRLIINMKERSPATLLASVHYDNTFSAGVVLNLTLKNILFKGSRAVLLGDISENPKIRFDYLKYMGRMQHVALNAIYDYHLLQIPSYEKGEIKDYATSTLNNFLFQALTTQSLKHSYSLGYEFSSFNERSKFSFNLPEGIDKTELNFHKIVLSYFRNSFNDRNFATKGSNTEIILKTFVGNSYSVKFKNGVETVDLNVEIDDTTTISVPITEQQLNEIIKENIEPDYFIQVYFNHKSITNFSTKFQLMPRVVLGTTISTEKEGAFYSEFRLGGVQKINQMDVAVFGLNFGELYTNNFALVGLTLQNVIWKSLFIQYGVNVLVHHEYVPIDNLSSIDWDMVVNENSLIGYGLNLRYKSLIGPISLGISRNSTDSYFRYYFQIGYSFNSTD